MSQNNQTQQPLALKKFHEETVGRVLTQVKELQETGGLDLPDNYSPANALKAAWFTILNTKDRNDKPALEACTATSITNALMQMCVEGLNPLKKQCAFIVYGNELAMSREYHGTIALAKRYNPEIDYVTANVIYQADTFRYEISPATGRRVILEHSQELENIDINKIRGAYCTVVFVDGTTDMEPMTMAQIRKAWEQGAMKGKSGAHTNFTDQMCKKTVINRTLKPYINSSDDEEVVRGKEDVITPGANAEIIDIDSEEVKEPPTPQKQAMEAAPTSAPQQEKKAEPVVPPVLNFG
jgi:recombination protein RecT